MTFYKNIFRLPASHRITVTDDKYHLSKYWELDLNREIIMDSDEDYALEFSRLFKEAVNCRLRSDFPVGFQLSGGLDSSAVVCTAREIVAGKLNKRLKTYSATFADTPECDESSYIEEVIKLGNLQHNEIKADKLSPLPEIEKYFIILMTVSNSKFIHTRIFPK
jgi:asparagine synthase (glutamine-hydrolysing)